MKAARHFPRSCFAISFALAVIGVANSFGAEPVTITVEANRPGAAINPAMWGAFFEDINFGADGGLYAEMIKNGSFEFPEPMMGWFKIIPSLAKGDATVLVNEAGNDAGKHYARIVSKAGAPMGISNVGFRGMGVREGDAYDFSVQIRAAERSPRVSIELVGDDGTTLASAPLEKIGSDWKKISATLRPKDTDANARLNIIVQGEGTIDLDRASLFPQKTWKGRPGGLRADMVQMLADLKPGFLRFPGGCIVEGSDLAKRYQWKKTIGPVEDRQLLVNRWNYEFKHRPAPDYFQSFGLGFFEFFQLCDDIGAEPLPILNCGMACQFNSSELCPPDELQTYIQDALDLIEFANGSTSSTWGAKRAEMGHPAPFQMKMLGIGNEQWGPQYIERLKLFTRALKEKHPEIQLICASGPGPEDDRFHFLWPKLNELKADIVDQHCYANPLWFLANTKRFDSYDRNGPKIFFGEYAAQSVAIVSTKNRNNLECALGEAAFMTGMERNADVVCMASYAPLFAHIDAWQWTPNLIWTDNLRVVATPNYYVQQMFTQNRGDAVLPVSNNAPVKEMTPAGRIGVGTNKAAAEFKDIEVSRGDTKLLTATASADGKEWSGGRSWRTEGGVQRQTDRRDSSSSFAGDKNWADYTLTLKARKLGEGSLVITVGDDMAGSRAQWVLGGPDQQHIVQTHYAEQDQILDRKPGTIEPERWYDIKITLNGSRMECSLDGQLLQTVDVLHHRVPNLFTSAARDEQSGETILKVVNPTSSATDATIKLAGTDNTQRNARAITLTGQLADENSLDRSTNVEPKSTAVPGIGNEFSYSFPPRSFTILRVEKAGGK